jgi:1-acyl-sn-glycerol-3-phosphate acyltransferase
LGRLARSIFEKCYAGYWWAVLAFIAAPLWLAVLIAPKLAWRQSALRIAVRHFLRLTAIPVEIRREDGVTPKMAIVAVNHASYVDALAIIVAFPGSLTFVAKEELARQFFAGTFLKRLGTLFVRRTDPVGGVEDTAAILAAVHRCERIVTFPEGTLTRSPGLMEFHLGAFVVAAEANIPVIPVTLSGTRSILRGDQWMPRRGRIVVRISTPIMPLGPDFGAAVHLRDAVRAEILGKNAEPDLALSRIGQ